MGSGDEVEDGGVFGAIFGDGFLVHCVIVVTPIVVDEVESVFHPRFVEWADGGAGDEGSA